MAKTLHNDAIRPSRDRLSARRRAIRIPPDTWGRGGFANVYAGRSCADPPGPSVKSTSSRTSFATSVLARSASRRYFPGPVDTGER
jgi:hypothetical protein